MLDFNIPQVKNKFNTDALTFLYLKSKPECKNTQQMGHFLHQTVLFYIDSEHLFLFLIWVFYYTHNEGRKCSSLHYLGNKEHSVDHFKNSMNWLPYYW